MSAPRIEPEWAMVTIAFADIRGFTSYADRATAREEAAYLTEFFSIAVPVLWEHGGQVTKLLGDGLMTVFGAPVADPGHADLAIAAATGLLDGVEAAMGERCRIEATRLMLDEPRPDLVSRGSIGLRGKAAPIAVYGLTADSVTLSGRPGRRTKLT